MVQIALWIHFTGNSISSDWDLKQLFYKILIQIFLRRLHAINYAFRTPLKSAAGQPKAEETLWRWWYSTHKYSIL